MSGEERDPQELGKIRHWAKKNKGRKLKQLEPRLKELPPLLETLKPLKSKEKP